jgi:uncharacterized protein (DUF2235 family)
MTQMSKQGRNIVVCLDGTHNTPTTKATNVIRIFRLASKAEYPNITFYSPGIGTMPRPGGLRFLLAKSSRVFDSASGNGMADNISSAYNFLNERRIQVANA